ncbi:beta-galactosidase-1-like protein 2 isoform X2 [Latimeria chalumnae]|uniref:Beta-galactosidase n=1 Tax=Latimeria chalumnae TaxID=7897 RepID=H3AFM9_LATCH|nr:PREDICTED: beta-galactosidase-1-like protein 2 isoform X2 [Latimeria chalumnae]|eukprot:XP_006006948.1 PREDICTED: beta-galactosidase-1-like protein 2 isoform X2 [Latimeria chalumnae]
MWFNWSGLVPAMMKTRNLGLQAETPDFQLEGEVFRILGGSMHYFRVPREYWRDRMLKMKACGLNTLTTYVAWNVHEAERGTFDFSANLDLQEYIRLAEEVGLWIILRPGPYICSEWDLGGLPSWLLQDPKMKVRTTYKGFTDAVDAFFDELLPRVVPLQYKKGGPIIAVQVENEYGEFSKTDPQYLNYVKEALLKRGIVEQLVTSSSKDGLKSGYVEGALATVNFQKIQPFFFEHLETVQPNKPKMVMEYWTGWFDDWGNYHHVFDADEMVKTVSEILEKGASINLYMFHGGTNFGFMNGAEDLDDYKPDITSYDYDAPLSEAGDYTPKFMKLRQLFSSYLESSLPELPAITAKTAYGGSIEMEEYLPVWDALPYTGKALKYEKPINMENLPVNNGNGQAYGYALYETHITDGGELHSKDNVRDRAQVFLDGKSIGFVNYISLGLVIPNGQGDRKLSILVENQGRANYGDKLDVQRKGLIGDVFFNNRPLENFTIYTLEMKPAFLKRLGDAQWKPLPQEPVVPGFFRTNLTVEYEPLDTFVKLVGWEKGVVFVNGRNLGRYWSIGPQETLYLPAPWLRQGDNEIIVFEENKAGISVQFVDTPSLGKTVSV